MAWFSWIVIGLLWAEMAVLSYLLVLGIWAQFPPAKLPTQDDTAGPDN